ncbi:hypothetical protein HMI55_003196 [Coelomomyces lativittatus]|nr:hypothetical protein HMI55_003196 [Coelomomyces lativittatus]
MTTHPPHPASSSSPRLLSKHEWTHHDDPSPPVELTTLFPSSMSSARLLDPEPPPPSPSPSLHRSSSSSTWSSPLSNTVLPPVSTTSSPPTEHKPSSCVCSWPSILLQHRTPRHQGGKNGVVAFLRRHWFLLTLPWVIGLAYLIPYVGQTGGPLRTEYSVKYAAVMVIFFFSGLGLEGSILKAFWVHWKVHVGRYEVEEKMDFITSGFSLFFFFFFGLP